MKTKSKQINRLTGAALLLACGILLPQAFHLFGVNNAGTIFLPMHIPVLLCGMICGWQWGAVVGFIIPFLSSIITTMPVMFPVGFSMMGELCVYGLVSGVMLCYVFKTKWRGFNIYASLIIAMLCGRAVSGVIKALLLTCSTNPFTVKAFLSGAFIIAWPGIVIQLVLIPLLITALDKAKITSKL